MTLIQFLKRSAAVPAIAAIALMPASALAETHKSEDTSGQAGQEDTSGQAGQTGQQQTGQTGQTAGQTGQQQTGQTAGQTGQQQTGQAAGQTGQQQTGEAADAAQPDALVATVGDNEIMRSDVMRAIGALPTQMRQQPPEMLIPLAIDQLVLRELILDRARAQNLATDPDVKALVQMDGQTALENAMVQVWLERQLEKSVTDAAVQETYEAVKAANDADIPPLETVRPQIEQQLRQQAFQEVRADLQTNADVTFYGPEGEPLETQPQTQ